MLSAYRLEDEILDVVRKYIGTELVVAATELYLDLNIAGHDAIDMLSEISARFGISFNDFEFCRYFPNDSENIGIGIARRLGYRSCQQSFTFAHLVAIVRVGHWFEPAPTLPLIPPP